MKTKDILAMRDALKQVGAGETNEAMDPVNKKAVKKDFDDRKDKDIDNDGDVDGSDKYLHKRRRKVTKAVQNPTKNKSETETVVQEDTEEVNELSKKTLGSYVKKAAIDQIGNTMGLTHGTPDDKKKAGTKFHKRLSGTNKAVDKLTKEDTSPLARYKARLAETNEIIEDNQTMNKVTGPALSVQGSKDVKQKAETSKTKDTSKLDKINAPKELDDESTHVTNRAAELKSAAKAASTQTDDVNKKTTVKEALDAIAINEDYRKNQVRYVAAMKQVVSEISTLADTLHNNHMNALAASDRIGKSYSAGKSPSEADVKASTTMMYDCKYIVRQLEDARDTLEEKLPREEMKESFIPTSEPVVETSRFGGSVSPETRKPVSTRDALAMMEERSMHIKGATKPQAYDDTWAPQAKDFANKHKVDEPDYADINKVTQMNKTEVGASLARTVNYRHNDQKIGDKKPVGNDGK